MPKTDRFCCAKNCFNSRESTSLTFFHFPKDDIRCKIWKANAGRMDLEEKTGKQMHSGQYLVCAEHFEDKYFYSPVTRNRLTRNAIPTVFSQVPVGSRLAPFKTVPIYKQGKDDNDVHCSDSKTNGCTLEVLKDTLQDDVSTSEETLNCTSMVKSIKPLDPTAEIENVAVVEVIWEKENPFLEPSKGSTVDIGSAFKEWNHQRKLLGLTDEQFALRLLTVTNFASVILCAKPKMGFKITYLKWQKAIP